MSEILLVQGFSITAPVHFTTSIGADGDARQPGRPKRQGLRVRL
jgi:hypothetical protein